jgi:hypothetical protein
MPAANQLQPRQLHVSTRVLHSAGSMPCCAVDNCYCKQLPASYHTAYLAYHHLSLLPPSNNPPSRLPSPHLLSSPSSTPPPTVYTCAFAFFAEWPVGLAPLLIKHVPPGRTLPPPPPPSFSILSPSPPSVPVNQAHLCICRCCFAEWAVGLIPLAPLAHAAALQSQLLHRGRRVVRNRASGSTPGPSTALTQSLSPLRHASLLHNPPSSRTCAFAFAASLRGLLGWPPCSPGRCGRYSLAAMSVCFHVPRYTYNSSSISSNMRECTSKSN